jgi:hypothetical protein
VVLETITTFPVTTPSAMDEGTSWSVFGQASEKDNQEMPFVEADM